MCYSVQLIPQLHGGSAQGQVLPVRLARTQEIQHVATVEVARRFLVRVREVIAGQKKKIEIFILLILSVLPNEAIS